MTTSEKDDDVNQYTTTSFDARTYLPNGNLHKINAGLTPASIRRNLFYDYANRMVGFVIPQGVLIDYYYDAFGRRVGWYDEITGDWITYYYDGNRVIEEQYASDTVPPPLTWSTTATYGYG